MTSVISRNLYTSGLRSITVITHNYIANNKLDILISALNPRGFRNYSPLFTQSLHSHLKIVPKSSSPQRRSVDLVSQFSSQSLSSNKHIMAGDRIKILPIRALTDNYMYLLVDQKTQHAAAVDPFNASAMANAISEHGVDLKMVLTTHHHYDHANGNSEMAVKFPEAIIYGGDMRVQAIAKQVFHGDTLKLGSLKIECLSTPCHTSGHVCYYVTCPTETSDTSFNSTERVVFTGDTLFIAGCGRFFEGSSDQMDYSLNTVLGNLPSDTKVYCGHEYTVTNLKFALSVEPDNQDIKSKLSWAQTKVSKKEPTVPSTIGEEKKINPFMRLDKPAVRKFTGETDDLEIMATLRQKKNDFGKR